jgi:hypothetical protein
MKVAIEGTGEITQHYNGCMVSVAEEPHPPRRPRMKVLPAEKPE